MAHGRKLRIKSATLIQMTLALAAIQDQKVRLRPMVG